MEDIDYGSVIKDLERRKAAFNTSIDAAIQALKAVLAAGNGGAPIDVQVTPDGAAMSSALTPHRLFGKSIPEAAIVCMQTYKRPMHSKEIAEALEAASYHHSSKNFVNTVNSILNRREDSIGDVVRVGKDWALSEWYPGRRKSRNEKGQSEGDPTDLSAANEAGPDESDGEGQ